MTEKIKVAVTGFENGHCYYLYLGLLNEPDVEVVAVSFAPHARINYEGRMGKHVFDDVDIFYDTEEMLLAHPEIQACVIGSANSKHAKEFRLCAQRGIHVISMKVPTLDMQEYDEMLTLQKKHGTKVFIELEMRWYASVRRVKELIEAGKIGDVLAFNAFNYSHNPMWWDHWIDIPEESYGKRIPIHPGDRIFRGGALTDHPHIFDLARYITGSDFDVVYAEAALNMRDGAECEDMVYTIGKMKNGVIFSLDPSYANREPEKARRINMDLTYYPSPVMVELQVVGTKGTMIVNPYGVDFVENIAPNNKYEVWATDLALDAMRRLFIRHFLSDIKKDENTEDVSLTEHKKTMQLVNAAYDSIFCGKPVEVEQ